MIPAAIVLLLRDYQFMREEKPLASIVVYTDVSGRCCTLCFSPPLASGYCSQAVSSNTLDSSTSSEDSLSTSADDESVHSGSILSGAEEERHATKSATLLLQQQRQQQQQRSQG